MKDDRSHASLEKATLGGGCFWCLEAAFQRLRGVGSAVPGYAGGHVSDPTYRQVCGGDTGHAEVVQVTFDPATLGYRELLEVFFALHDPTTRDREGPDVGPQYRSIVLVHHPEQERIVQEVIRDLEESGAVEDPVVTEVKPLETFYPAEEPHHDYYRRNPGQAYCRLVIDPKIQKLTRQFRDRLVDDTGGDGDDARPGGSAASGGEDRQ